jgi:hypothetical protein
MRWLWCFLAAPTSARNKSLFAAFSSEKEESSFFEKKAAKKLLSLRWFGGDPDCEP